MGRPPAVVIVTRHGARLDAADKHWHLTSPAPYDSPLTYGGWTQCRALGGKIASLLRARELLFQQTLRDNVDAPQTQTNGNNTRHGQGLPQRRKKHRIMIHSSPFLRCVQTSVAIAAGISQYRDYDESEDREPANEPVQTSIRLNKSGQSKLASIQDEDEASGSGHTKDRSDAIPYFKPRLRIDAFLGEWLSPDYYESITPPPNSVLMVATAKAELLRRGEHIQMPEEPRLIPSIRGNFPGGWGSRPGSSGSQVSEADDLGKKLADTDIGQPSPISRSRSRTQGDFTSDHEQTSLLDRTPARNSVGYVPPVPPYAVSPSEPIPTGYFQHARDACVDVDFQWDSMRAPQEWGDGGELGEEWSAMHKRFRKGLHSMVSWYALHHESALQSHGRSRLLHPHPEEPDDDDDTDLVVVLVTHGAGCNALIGALTNQPVLLDVAMASLTMAVTRERPDANDGPRTSYAPIAPSLPRYANERPLSIDYMVTLTASTEHLTHNPFIPVSLRDLQPQPRIPSASSVVRRSSRRRYIPGPVVPGHDRSSSLSQLPTNLDSPRFGISRSNTGSTDGGSSNASGPAPRSAPNGMVSGAALPSAPTSAPGLWSRPSTREGSGHPRSWSLLSQSSNASDSGTSATSGPGRAGGWMVTSPAHTTGKPPPPTREDEKTTLTPIPSKDETEPPAPVLHHHHHHKHTTSAAVASDTDDSNPDSRPPSPLHRPRTIDSDEITERERGAKRRWTTSQPELEHGESL